MDNNSDQDARDELEIRLAAARRSKELGVDDLAEDYLRVLGHGRTALLLIGIVHLGFGAYWHYVLSCAPAQLPTDPTMLARYNAFADALRFWRLTATAAGLVYLVLRRFAIRYPIQMFGCALFLFAADSIYLGWAYPERLGNGIVVRLLIIATLVRSLLAGVTNRSRLKQLRTG